MTRENSLALLKWTTASESNSEQFEIQRSLNGKQWIAIGFIQAAGESSQLASYSFLDAQPAAGSNLYRLKMVDKDQSSAYSPVREITFVGSAQIRVFPNPVSSTLFIDGGQTGTIQQTAIYNLMGQRVYQSQAADSQSVNVQHFAAGIYIVKTVLKDGSSTENKIVIVH